MTMKNEIKQAIIVGIIITLIWGLYITFIYMNNPQEDMVIKEKCREPNTSSTKICNEYNFPRLLTTFGWMN